MISPSQSRTARALLAWSQHDLAERAKVGSSTIADFERGTRSPIEKNIEAIQAALENGGARFLADSVILEADSATVIDLTKTSQPIRWIDSTDLDHWADRRDSQSLLPELISRLLVATYGSFLNIHFPAGDSVQYSGFDGVSDFSVARHPVPAGYTVWELGSTGTKIKTKAQIDYDKRSRPTAGLTQSQSTFVFVTPRRWTDKEKWVAACLKDATWRNVQVIDADDLVHWLDLCPQVSYWLAIKIGKRPLSVQSLEEKWAEWSNATQPQLSTAVVLISRDEETTSTLKWLRAEPNVFSVKADSSDEALVFLYSAIRQFPEYIANTFLARALVVTTPSDARQIGGSASPLVLCMTFIEPGLAHNLAGKGHHVFVACVSNQTVPDGALGLSRPDRYVLKDLLTELLEKSPNLQNSSYPWREAERLAANSGRSLTILKRQMAASPDLLPSWATSARRPMMAALMANGWNAAITGDTHVLSQLAGCSYEEFERQLAPILSMPDSPLVKSGSAWRIASPRDAFSLLAGNITEIDLDQFVDLFVSIMCAPDPRFHLKSDKRWLAGLDNIGPDHSPLLRRGLAETAILFSVLHNSVSLAPDCQRRIDKAVYRILGSASGEIWWSLRRDFQLLAEASPDAFLDAMEAKLDVSQSPLMELFKEADGPIGGEEYLSNLLWGLERIAWIKICAPRVADILLRLSILDPGGKWGNRPSGTLRNMFLNWSPQCSLTLSERLEIIDSLRARHGKSSWAFVLNLAPKTHDHVSPSAQPQWRDFDEAFEVATYELLDKANDEIGKRLLKDVGNNPNNWIDVFEVYDEFSDARRADFRQVLAKTLPAIKQMEACDGLQRALRRFVNRHREFADTDWALPEIEIAELYDLVLELEPNKSAKSLVWLFEPNPPLPNPVSAKDYEARDQQAHKMRVEAVQFVLTTDGFDGLIALALESQNPYLIGNALEEAGLKTDEEYSLLDNSIASDQEQILEIARGFFRPRHYKDEIWCVDYWRHAQNSNLAIEKQAFILLSFGVKRSTWDLVEASSESVADAYWSKTGWRFLENEADCVYVAEKLLFAKRPRATVNFLGSCRAKNYPTSLILTALEAGINAPSEDQDGYGNEGTMFNWHVGNLFKRLDSDSDLNRDVIAKLEWAYFRVLTQSERQPKELPRSLAENPGFFVQLLSLVYMRSGGVEDNDKLDIGEDVVRHANKVLQNWSVIPGTCNNNSIDQQALMRWLMEARRLSKEAGRLDSADFCIGKMLASVRPTENTLWPPIAIRVAIEKLKSDKINRGYSNGLFNGRGVTSRGMGDGGALERKLAELYRAHAADCRVHYPVTARILENMARSYDSDAKRHDEDAIRQQW